VIAAWYDRQGPADEVLRVSEMPTPEPDVGEVRVRVSLSSVNPGDTKKRRGWTGAEMPYPRVIPHSDGVGVIDAVGRDVDASRVGEAVWVFGAQSYRACGTAAQQTVVPDWQTVPLPDGVPAELAACLGIPGITAHQAVFCDGDVAGRTVVVHGVLGAVGSLAAQLARWKGATVIGTVRRRADLDCVRAVGIDSAVPLDAPDAADRLRDLAGDTVDRIIDVAFGDNIDLNVEIAGDRTHIVAYATGDPTPRIPFWPLLFKNVTIRLLGSDDFSRDAKTAAAADLTTAARERALSVPVATPLPLRDIAEAHDRVDRGTRERIVLEIPLS